MDAKPTQQFSIILSNEMWRGELKFTSKEQIEKLKQLGILAKLETENESGNNFYNWSADFSMWKKRKVQLQLLS